MDKPKTTSYVKIQVYTISEVQILYTVLHFHVHVQSCYVSGIAHVLACVSYVHLEG